VKLPGGFSKVGVGRPAFWHAVSQPQRRLSKQRQLPIDPAVRQASRLACRDIRSKTRLIDRHQPLVIEARQDRLEFDLHVSDLPSTCDLVMLKQGIAISANLIRSGLGNAGAPIGTGSSQSFRNRSACFCLVVMDFRRFLF
jgi:hypothetical protein